MEDDIQSKSKTQIKKEAEDLQKLGEELTQLTKPQLDRLEISDRLRNALIDARFIKSNIAGRRHRQFIGALMRDVDPEPLRLALLQADTDSGVASESEKQTQVWIDKLLTSDSTVIEAFISSYPEVDRQRLKQVLRNISKKKKNKTSSKSLKTLEQIIMKCLKEK